MLKRAELADPQSCLNRAREDEMIFVLVEHDESAVDAVMAWVEARIKRGQNKNTDPKIKTALQWVWQVQTRRAQREERPAGPSAT